MKRAFVTFLLLYGTVLGAAGGLSRELQEIQALFSVIINRRIADCEREIQDTRMHVIRISDRVGNCEEAVRGLEDHANRIAALEEDAARLEANVTFLLQRSHDSIEVRHRHTQQLARTDRTLARHEGWLNFLMRSIAEQNDRIAQQEEEMRQLGGAIEDLNIAIGLMTREQRR